MPLLDALVSWSLPVPAINAAYAELDALTKRVGRLCGAEAVRDLPGEPAVRRARLIELLEDLLGG